MSSHHHNKEKHQHEQSSATGATGAAPGAEQADAVLDPPGPRAEQSRGPSNDASPASLAEQIQQLLGEKQELMNMMVRRQADFENYRKRVEKERNQDRHRGVELLIENLLPVLDAFDRALVGQKDPAAAEYVKGFEMIRRQLWDTLAKQGVSRIESVGKEFNPHFHHAIEQVPTYEHPEGTVIGEMQPGYMFQDRVLRAAMVRVAAQPEQKPASVGRRDN